jgi:hypothetical protein
MVTYFVICLYLGSRIPDPKIATKREVKKGGGTHFYRFKYFSYCFHFSLFRFVSVQSNHRNSMFRYRSETTETNILFQIVPKPVLVPVSVVSNRN